MKRIFVIVATLMSLLLASTSCTKMLMNKGGDIERVDTFNIFVAPETQIHIDDTNITDPKPITCMKIRINEDDEWTLMPLGTIEGFNYEEGYKYQIRVERTIFRYAQDNGEYVFWKFISEISKELVTG